MTACNLSSTAHVLPPAGRMENEMSLLVRGGGSPWSVWEGVCDA
jgi:hypothetical protein